MGGSAALCRTLGKYLPKNTAAQSDVCQGQCAREFHACRSCTDQLESVLACIGDLCGEKQPAICNSAPQGVAPPRKLLLARGNDAHVGGNTLTVPSSWRIAPTLAIQRAPSFAHCPWSQHSLTIWRREYSILAEQLHAGSTSAARAMVRDGHRFKRTSQHKRSPSGARQTSPPARHTPSSRSDLGRRGVKDANIKLQREPVGASTHAEVRPGIVGALGAPGVHTPYAAEPDAAPKTELDSAHAHKPSQLPRQLTPGESSSSHPREAPPGPSQGAFDERHFADGTSVQAHVETRTWEEPRVEREPHAAFDASLQERSELQDMLASSGEPAGSSDGLSKVAAFRAGLEIDLAHPPSHDGSDAAMHHAPAREASHADIARLEGQAGQQEVQALVRQECERDPHLVPTPSSFTTHLPSFSPEPADETSSLARQGEAGTSDGAAPADGVLLGIQERVAAEDVAALDTMVEVVARAAPEDAWAQSLSLPHETPPIPSTAEVVVQRDAAVLQPAEAAPASMHAQPAAASAPASAAVLRSSAAEVAEESRHVTAADHAAVRTSDIAPDVAFEATPSAPSRDMADVKAAVDAEILSPKQPAGVPEVPLPEPPASRLFGGSFSDEAGAEPTRPEAAASAKRRWLDLLQRPRARKDPRSSHANAARPPEVVSPPLPVAVPELRPLPTLEMSSGPSAEPAAAAPAPLAPALAGGAPGAFGQLFRRLAPNSLEHRSKPAAAAESLHQEPLRELNEVLPYPNLPSPSWPDTAGRLSAPNDHLPPMKLASPPPTFKPGERSSNLAALSKHLGDIEQAWQQQDRYNPTDDPWMRQLPQDAQAMPVASPEAFLGACESLQKRAGAPASRNAASSQELEDSAMPDSKPGPPPPPPPPPVGESKILAQLLQNAKRAAAATAQHRAPHRRPSQVTNGAAPTDSQHDARRATPPRHAPQSGQGLTAQRNQGRARDERGPAEVRSDAEGSCRSPLRDAAGAQPSDGEERSALDLMLEFAQGAKRQRAAQSALEQRMRSRQEAEQQEAEESALAKQLEKQEAQVIHLHPQMTLLQLANELDVATEELEDKFALMGERLDSAFDIIPLEAAELVCLDYGVECEVEHGESGEMLPRPPVVTILGHVDHGKTTLLDRLRSSNVAEGEAGGITQHIGAFSVTMPSSSTSITFLDTPGHAAFSAMRSRGARVTDIAVLVVAADDGVMPQTREAIAHARDASCPILVALTKCDRDGADPARVRQELLAEGLELDDVGGDVQVIETAAVTGQGLQELEEAILLQAEMLELKAATAVNAEATVVETTLDIGQGPLATVVMQKGCLRVGQAVVVGKEFGRVRAIRGSDGRPISEALPGMPVQIAGLRGLPHAGDSLRAMVSEDRARRLSESRVSRYRTRHHQHMEELAKDHYDVTVDPETGEEVRTLRPSLALVLVADVDGSLEALTDALLALNTRSAVFKVVSASVGKPVPQDVKTAASANALLVAFGVNVPGSIKKECERLGVELHQHRVIYKLLDVLSEKLVQRVPVIEEAAVVGRVNILATFEASVKKSVSSTKKVLVAGCRVAEGHVRRDSHQVRVMRNQKEVWSGRIRALRQVKTDVNQVGKGSECGIMFEDGWSDFQVGDTIEVVELMQRQPQSAAVAGGGFKVTDAIAG